MLLVLTGRSKVALRLAAPPLTPALTIYIWSSSLLQKVLNPRRQLGSVLPSLANAVFTFAFQDRIAWLGSDFKGLVTSKHNWKVIQISL